MAATHDNYLWRETSAGVWQRDADDAEVFYSSLIKLYEGSGRMHFAITGHVSLTVDVPANATPEATAVRVDECLRTAWLRLRHEMPTIAAQVRWDAAAQKWVKMYETVPDEVAQASWLGNTFKSVSTGQTGAEWANSDPPAPPVATLFVVSPPQDSPSLIRRDLVLRSPHDVIDGIGTLLLFNQLAALFSETFAKPPAATSPILDGRETCRLSPPYRVAANVPPVPTPAQAAKLAALRSAKGRPIDNPTVRALSLPFNRGALIPSRHQRIALTLSPEQTTNLLSALKALDATPTHAFHAGIALTLRNTCVAHHSSLSSTTHLRYSSYLLRNERPACQPPFNTAQHAAAVYHSVSGGELAVTLPATPPAGPHQQQQRDEFLAVLTQIRKHYHLVRDDADHSALAPYLWADAAPPLDRSALDHGRTVPVPPPNETPSVSISSMGLIDKLICPVWEASGVRVYEPWVTGEELGTGFGVFLGTFRGRLEVSVAFNEAWHGREEVEEFLEGLVGGVLGSLGLR